jgi:hypothetical protein
MVRSEAMPDLWVCDRCERIGTQQESAQHASTFGHPSRKLTAEEAHALRDEWEREGRDRPCPAPRPRNMGKDHMTSENRRRRREAPRRARPNCAQRGGATLTLRVPWKFSNGALPMMGEVARLVGPDGTTCVGLLEDAKPIELPHGAYGVLLLGRVLPADTGHATWELQYEFGDVVRDDTPII